MYLGDCLDILSEYVADASVDLIYLDPPFNSKRIYNAFLGGSQWVAFDDTWRWHEAVDDFDAVASDVFLADMMEGLRRILGPGPDLAYLSYMANRLRECRRVLKPSGSLYLHCDPTMSHYLKVVMDGIFGRNQFRNEIVWFYPDTPGRPKQDFPRKSDHIFRYVRGKTWTFNADAVRVPILPESVERYQTGRTIGGRTYVGGASAEKGKIPENVWRMAAVKGNSAESQGYPTQKPLPLIERIIKASSNPGDTVLDPFCGCGTTVHAAQNLGRRWIGIDVCANACKVIRNRLENHFDSLWNQIEFVGIPKTVDDARTLAEDPFKFERWAATLVPYMEANRKQVADHGIDGRGRLPIRKGVFVDMVAQVKAGHVTPSHVQAFNGARQEAQADLGIFTCFEKRVTHRMREAAANTGRFREWPRVQIYTVEDYFAGRQPNLPLGS